MRSQNFDLTLLSFLHAVQIRLLLANMLCVPSPMGTSDSTHVGVEGNNFSAPVLLTRKVHPKPMAHGGISLFIVIVPAQIRRHDKV
jgi:hypothetical protein